MSGIARSTFFYHQSKIDQDDKYARLKEEITSIFDEFKHRYGYRRVHAELRRRGWVVNHKLVHKLMKQLGLVSKVRKKKKYSSYHATVSRVAKNVLDRQFNPDKPNVAWVSDVTEFRVAGTKMYLSPVMDLFDRMILGYELSTSPNTALTARSLNGALKRYTPDKGLIVHTDQGFQYQHSSWRDLIASAGAVQSMSRKGNCYDNAVMENFFGHLKSEMYHGETFASIEEFRRAIDDYITWYNNDRLQARIKGLTPAEYRIQTLDPLTA